MSLGGIETLILRMAQSQLNHKFAFLFLRRPKKRTLMNDLKLTSSLVIEDINVLLLSLFKHQKSVLLERLKKFGMNHVNCIYVFNAQSLVIACCLQKLFPGVKICMGVYHFNEYLWENKPTTYIQKEIYKIIHLIPDENIFFMNSATKNINQSRLPKRFNASPIVNVPLDVNRFGRIMRNPNKFKIISVGRLVHFKNYNFHLIPIVKSLHQIDPRITYHIYGYGTREKELIKAIHDQQAEQCVFFHGPVSYDQYPEVLKDAYLFVGCGTALLEASAAGVPSLIGPCLGEKVVTYGWTCDQEDANTGEYCAEKPVLSYHDLLTKAFRLDESHYAMLSQATKLKMGAYSADKIIRYYIDCWENAKTCEIIMSHWSLLRFVASNIFTNILGKWGLSFSHYNRYHNYNFLKGRE